MSASANKQDMSMDDILASIRSYVSEGQNLPKSAAATTSSNASNVIQLTDEVIPIDTVSMPLTVESSNQFSANQNMAEQKNPMYPEPRVAPNPFAQGQSNPFNRLANEINASVVSAPALSSDDLLNQLATPLIKSWLDQNLRKIVEEIVQKEIDRMKRG